MMKLALASLVLFRLMMTDAIAREDADGFYEIYENWGYFSLNAPPPDMKPIVLQIPEGFSYVPLGHDYPSSGKTVRSRSVNVLTYYPSFLNPKAPENRAFGLDCSGYCNGRILIAISNATHLMKDRFPNMANFMATAGVRREPYRATTISDLKALHGFSRGYEVPIPTDIGRRDSSEQYFFHFGPDKIHYDLFTKCLLNDFTRTCTLHFSLTCNPAIYIAVA
jgi:hypothetical protein